MVYFIAHHPQRLQGSFASILKTMGPAIFKYKMHFLKNILFSHYMRLKFKFRFLNSFRMLKTGNSPTIVFRKVHSKKNMKTRQVPQNFFLPIFVYLCTPFSTFIRMETHLKRVSKESLFGCGEFNSGEYRKQINLQTLCLPNLFINWNKWIDYTFKNLTYLYTTKYI